MEEEGTTDGKIALTPTILLTGTLAVFVFHELSGLASIVLFPLILYPFVEVREFVFSLFQVAFTPIIKDPVTPLTLIVFDAVTSVIFLFIAIGPIQLSLWATRSLLQGRYAAIVATYLVWVVFLALLFDNAVEIAARIAFPSILLVMLVSLKTKLFKRRRVASAD